MYGKFFFGAKLLFKKISHECDQSFSRTRRAQHEQPLAHVVKFFVGENFSLQLREIFEAEFCGEFKNLFFFFQKKSPSDAIISVAPIQVNKKAPTFAEAFFIVGLKVQPEILFKLLRLTIGFDVRAVVEREADFGRAVD